MIDDKKFDRTLRRFQPESMLLLHGCEYIGPGLKGQLAAAFWRGESGVCELQLEVVESFEPGLVENGARQHTR